MEIAFTIVRIILVLSVLLLVVLLFCGGLSDEATKKEKEQFKKVKGKPKK